jgi:hypothetical protein
MPYLALFKHEKGPDKPSTSGNMFSFGTGQLSSCIIPVIDALNPFLFFRAGVSRVPGGHADLSIKNPLILPVSASLAQMTKTSAIGELVIQVFAPDNE